jgi:hypothetical protein
MATSAEAAATGYDAFARYYDAFTADSDYDAWGNSVLELVDRHGVRGRRSSTSPVAR